MIKKVCVGVSGGVDSAVAAFLLKNKGFHVEGVFMQNWDITDEKGHCSADADYKDAKIVCDILGIKLGHVNFVKQYWNEVFLDLISEYQAGCTPNPDILCNRHVKFNHFYKYARENLGADAIATGHYANTSFGPFLEHYKKDTDVRMFKAKDNKKDQTFFLSQINQEALRRTMFPLGNLTKFEVKQIAFENGLGQIAKKKESMGICFIGSRKFQDFIREYISDKPGNFVNINNAEVVGTHLGIHQWTLGQRSRISGVVKPYFIAKKNPENNTIIVAQGTTHPFLFSDLFFTSPPHWIHSQPPELAKGQILECDFLFQHTQNWVPCELSQTQKGLVVRLLKPKRAITAGQYAVFTKNNEVLGGARIQSCVTMFAVNYLRNGYLKKYTELLETNNLEIKEQKIKVTN